MILVVGKPSNWTALARALPRGVTLRFDPIEALTPAHLRELKPDLVLSPLLGDGFDAVEVAQRLAKAGFQGRFRVVAPPLLNPEVVRAEVQEAAEEIDFDLMVMGGRPH